MTESEVIKVLADLHTLHLVNEPKDVNDLVYTWLAFFHDDDARIINKACYIYTKIKKKRFWPTPGDIEELKTRAAWLVEMDYNKEAEALGGSTYIPNSTNPIHLPPRTPAINIAEQAQSFCDLCGLCDIRDQSLCPIDF
jgi:hypothetical protein